ncbi:ATP-binding protein [Porticoccaceae bacterium]|nr:ATP-binding protein [Porticoccaceae bacterium]
MTQMDLAKRDRRKATMVLGTIEESLGSFVLENTANSDADESLGFSDVKIQDAVEEGYLNDIFQLAMAFSKGTPKSNSVKKLYQMFVDLDIWEIRNCCAHPNRPWRLNFWYKIALVAADDAFHDLGLYQVTAALASAEKGELTDPPEGWDKQYTRHLPNNLPPITELQITGLIGRDTELKDLKKIIENKRNNSVAIVAPGGFGKTALALQVLEDIAKSNQSGRWLDLLAYITLKTETWNGKEFITLEAGQEIESIEKAVADALSDILNEHIDDLDHAIEAFGDRRIILCIDNLETILRDDPLSFEELAEKLPYNWKILVTSRVTISNSYIYPLKELKLKGATHLARIYHKGKGGQLLSQEKYQKIAEDCCFNPLAIKMMVDIFLSGREFPDSINTAKENIASFSFSELLDCLSKDSVEVLQMMFAEPGVTRSRICQVLKLSLDCTAQAINELSNTSLITRVASEESEFYEINGSVRDLLLTDSQCQRIRTDVQNKIASHKNTARSLILQQAGSDAKIWYKSYIPLEIGDGLKTLLGDFPKIRFDTKHSPGNNERIRNTYNALSLAKDTFGSDCVFHRTYAFILEELQSFPDAEKHYHKALEIDSENIVTQYHLARFYHFKLSDYTRARVLSKSLIDRLDGLNPPNIDPAFRSTIYQGFFISSLYDGEPDEVLKYTKKWKEHSELRSLFGTYRASAFKRKVENIVDHDPDKVANYLTSAVRILEDVLRTDGYSKQAGVEGGKLIEEFEFCFCRHIYAHKYPELGKEILDFSDKHLRNIADLSPRLGLLPLIERMAGLELSDNPFKESKWQDLLMLTPTDNFCAPKDIKEKFHELSVDRFTTDDSGRRRLFLFASDAKGTQYFVHIHALEGKNHSATREDWAQMQLGTKIACIEAQDEGKAALVVKRAYLLV